MKNSAFGRHKAAASIAAGHDPGSYLRTGTAKPKKRRKHRRGKKPWTIKKELISKAAEALSYYRKTGMDSKVVDSLQRAIGIIRCGFASAPKVRSGKSPYSKAEYSQAKETIRRYTQFLPLLD